MKFVVTKDGMNTTEVKLHWETKDKIKAIACWTAVGVIFVGTIIIAAKMKPKDTEEE